MDSIEQDIYYIKQIPNCAILAPMLFWNRAGHLLYKTNPDLSYFELSYVFWEHNDSVGRGTTLSYFLAEIEAKLICSKFLGPVKFFMVFSSKSFHGLALKNMKNNVENFPRSLKYDAKHGALVLLIAPTRFSDLPQTDIRCYSGREQ